MKNNYVNASVDKDEATYDYLMGLASAQKNKRREKLQRQQDERANRKARGKSRRDSRKFAEMLDDEDYSY